MTEVQYSYETRPLPENPPKALFWRLFVRPLKPIEKTASGIVLSAGGIDKAQEYNTYIGEVISVGGLAFQAKTTGGLCMSDDPNIPKVGSFVIYSKYAGQRMQAKNGDTYIVLDDDSILGVVDDPNEYRIYL
jgi:co-chaperonin GroES (HSP10)